MLHWYDMTQRVYNTLLWNKNIAVHGFNMQFHQEYILTIQCVAAEENNLNNKPINVTSYATNNHLITL
jgi:hypothetical protein